MTDNCDTPLMPGMDQYEKAIDNLHFSAVVKERMTTWLADAVVCEAQKASATSLALRRRQLPMAAVVAGIALALGAGGVAYAAGGLVNIGSFVSHLFGADEAKVEIVDQVGRPVDASQSRNGVTVSADAIIGDRSNVAVVFSITRDDGAPFNVEPLDNGLLPLGFSERLDVSLPLFSGGWGATGSSYFYDADPADGSIQLVEIRSLLSDEGAELSLLGQTMTAHLSDLTYYPADGSDPVVVADGDWVLSFPLDYEDTSMELPAGETFDLNGCTATVDSISISPIALHLAYTADEQPYTGDLTLGWAGGPSGRGLQENATFADILLRMAVTVNLTDGTSFVVDDRGGGGFEEDGSLVSCEKSILWDRILDLDEVVSITIGGTTIEL